MDLIRGIVDRAPDREPASEGERVAQQMIESEFKKLGLETSWQGFRFHRSIYGDFALHFGLGIFATAISGIVPMVAALIHGLVAFSYAMQSTRRYAVLRRLYWQRKSQNLMGVMPAAGKVAPALRLVFMGHADAAYTGLVFQPVVVNSAMKAKGPFKRSVALATWCLVALVGFDLLRFFDVTIPFVRIVEWVLTVPAMIAFFLNFDVYVRRERVPGANDNLSAAATLPILASRLAAAKPDDVELVFSLNGCEEAGLGGAIALAGEIEGKWDRSNTVFINMDGLSNGQLCYIDPEGELFRLHPTPRLVQMCREVSASRPGFAPFQDVKPFDITIGGTDMAALLTRGWSGISFVAIDPTRASPRFYHTPEDTPDNIDQDELMASIDFIEQLALKVMKDR